MMLWTEPMDAVLKEAWRAGYTTPQIAVLIFRRLGCAYVTPSAVRGRRSQLGLAPRGHLELSIAGKHKPGSKAGPPKRARHRQDAAPGSLCIPWAERAFNQCAYPLGEGAELLACAAPIRPGAKRPYCPFHLELTRQEPRAA